MPETTVANPPEDIAALMQWAAAQLEVPEEIGAYPPKAVFQAVIGVADLPDSGQKGSINGIIARILDATTLDDALLGAETSGLDELLGVDVWLSKPRWFPSEYKEGARAFCVAEAATVEDGVVSTIVFGSIQPQVIVWRAWAEDRLPLCVRFTKATKATAGGFFPYNLEAGRPA